MTLVGSVVGIVCLQRLSAQMGDATVGSSPTADMCRQYRIAALAKDRSGSLSALGDLEEARSELACARDLLQNTLRNLQTAARIPHEEVSDSERLGREADPALDELVPGVDREEEVAVLGDAGATELDLILEDLDRRLAPPRGVDIVRRARTLLVILTAASMLGSVVITFMMASRLAGPLPRLADPSGRIATGQPAVTFGFNGLDETRELAERFDLAGCESASSCEALLASEARYRTLFEYARDGVVVLDERGRLIQANAAAESLLGRRIHDLQDMAFQDLLPAAERDPFLGRLRGLIEAGEPHAEMELVRSDGSRVPAEAAAARLPEGNIVLTLRDLSQRREMEQALVQGEKLGAVGRLAAGVAHELRNPLFVISNVLYDLREQLDSGLPEVKDDLQMADEENRRARLIIDNLLEFARPADPGDCRLELAPSIQQVLRLFRESFVQRHIELEVNLRETRPCHFNPDAFKQVMVNLLSNAMDAMPSGGRLTIGTATSQDGGVEVFVADTGRGMSLQEQKQIFTPFYSTKKEGRGTGLGLWIVHLTVERYRGRVRVHSAEGRGTKFGLELAPLGEAA